MKTGKNNYAVQTRNHNQRQRSSLETIRKRGDCRATGIGYFGPNFSMEPIFTSCAGRRLAGFFTSVLILSVGPRTVCAQPANEPLEKFVVTDGSITSLATNDNVLYFGGLFSQV